MIDDVYFLVAAIGLLLLALILAIGTIVLLAIGALGWSVVTSVLALCAAHVSDKMRNFYKTLT